MESGHSDKHTQILRKAGQSEWLKNRNRPATAHCKCKSVEINGADILDREPSP
jgi:hypothetical protein